MNKISIKKFCEEYENMATDSMREKYLKDHLEVIHYLPVLTKTAMIDNLTNITMLDKNSGNVKVNSIAEYLLFTRILVENYTNLAVESKGFYEEYDALKKSGLFDVLLVGNDATPPLIPYAEIAEFKHLLSLKKQDIMTNKYELHSYINEQIDRFSTLFDATMNPILETIGKKIENIPKEEINNIVEFVKKSEFKEV